MYLRALIKHSFTQIDNSASIVNQMINTTSNNINTLYKINGFNGMTITSLKSNYICCDLVLI